MAAGNSRVQIASEQDPKPATGRPRVALFALGGTIASAAGSGSRGADVTLTPEELVATIPGLGEIATIEARSLRQVPSGDLTMSDALEVAQAIRTASAQGFNGAVVTQGTDTLEEVAFVLDSVVDASITVVVTGAMRNASLPGSDGPANLLAAVRVATDPSAGGMGALVVFNDEIHAARFVRKRGTTTTATFGSPLTGPLGVVVEDRVSVFVRPRGRILVHLPDDPPARRVALVPIGFDDAGDLLEAAGRAAFDGIVVAAFGAGHVPRRLVPVLRDLNDRVPVVIASRTFAGDMLASTYSYPGGEMDLRAAGLTFAGAYDAIHARVLVQLLLMAGASRSDITRAFAAGLTQDGTLSFGSPA